MNFKVFIASLIIVFSLDTFSLTPLVPLQFFSLLLSAFFGFIILFFSFISKKYFLSFRSPIILIFLLMILSFIAARNVLNQSFIDSLIGNRYLLIVFSVIPLYFLGLSKQNIIQVFKNVFLVGLLIAVFTLFLGLSKTEISFNSILGNSSLVVSSSKISRNIIYFSAIFSLLKFLDKRRISYFIFFLICFFSTQSHDIQRTDLINFFIIGFSTYALFLSKEISLTIFFKYSRLYFVIFASFITLYIASITFPNSETIKKFSILTPSILNPTENLISDASISARVFQTEWAIQKIRENPLIGVGNLSNKNLQKFKGNTYFFKEDIGVMGFLVIHGFLGAFILLQVFKKIWNQSKPMERQFDFIHFIFASQLIIMFVMTLRKGSVIYNPTIILGLFTLVLIYNRLSSKRIKNEL